EPAAPTAPALPAELAAAVAQLHEAVEAERVRVGGAPAALLVVKDGQVIHAAGYGTRDGSGGPPVDADTVFPMGSVTKAFTAMLVMQAVDEGKLSLSDSPKTCLPEFALRDPNADSKATVRDLLTHRLGLAAMDLAWNWGQLTRAEALAVAFGAEPLHPYGERFRYQSLMVVAAGECAARALGGSYEDLVRTRILQPLGMDAATLSFEAWTASTNRAQGHARVGDARALRAVPPQNVDAIAPAGGLSASVRTMAPWLTAMLDEGRFEETTLVSADAFSRLVAPHVTVAADVQYGLGWFVEPWRGQRRLWHTGGVDGFYSLVALLPEHELGFVFVTADESGEMAELVTDRVFELAGSGAEPAPTGATLADDALGTYGSIGGFQAVLARDAEGRATLTVPQRPPYPLRDGADGAFQLGPPAPPGLSARVSVESGVPTLSIVQPQGPIALPKLPADALAAAKDARVSKDDRAVLGTYQDAERGVSVRLVDSQGRVALSAAGQVPAPLVAQGEDRYGLDGLPNAFSVVLVRKRGRVVGIDLAQPQGALSLTRVPGTEAFEGTAESLLADVGAAHGSAALAKHRTMEIHSHLAFVHEGVEASAQTRWASPNRFADTLEYRAGGKVLGSRSLGHDGTAAWRRYSHSTLTALSAIEREALGHAATFDPWAEPLRGWTGADVLGVDLLPGVDEPVVIVARTSASGIVWTDAIGRRTKLLHQRTTSTPTGRGETSVEVQRFSDYRDVGGVQIPHRVDSSTESGAVVATVESVRFDVAFSADALQPPR
ncbi:MAG: serine hydrolase domain-containing protein, partial [Myxococcota bacterium]